MTMQPPFAAGREEPVDDEDAQHFFPIGFLAADRQPGAEEVVEAQGAPQFVREPARAPLPRAFEREGGEAHLERFHFARRRRAVLGKQRQLAGSSVALINDGNGAFPSEALAVVDLAQIQHVPVRDLVSWIAPALDDGPTAVNLPVFAPLPALEEHEPQFTAASGRAEGGRSGLHALWKTRRLPRNHLRSAQGGKIVFPGASSGSRASRTSQFNGGSARVRGFELSYSQRLVWLPGVWKNFGVTANYTRLESWGNYSSGAVTTGAELDNFVPETMNLGLSYAYRAWDVRIKMNYRGQSLYAYSSDPVLRNYRFPKRNYDLNIKYNFSSKLGVFVDVINVFDAPLNDTYLYVRDRPRFTMVFATALKAGITGRF